MASTEHEKHAPAKGSSSRFVLIAAGLVVVGLVIAFVVGNITDPEPMGLGLGERTDADPVIVTEPTTEGAEAPLTTDAQGSVRVELGSTPPDTTD